MAMIDRRLLLACLCWLAWPGQLGACTGPQGLKEVASSQPGQIPVQPRPPSGPVAPLDAGPEPRHEDDTTVLAVVNDKGELLDALSDAGPAPGADAASQERVYGRLDRDIVRSYVQNASARIRYCYTRELRKKPTLQGTVVVSFQIGPDGRVLSASARGVHANVAACVRDSILAIQFPRVPGGGVVDVQYPFTFRPVEP